MATDSRSRKHIPDAFAAKLETARASRTMEGERRVVTILFCDVKGSTAMAEQLDPEEWAEIMNEAFQHLIAPVYRYEGNVARLMGDAILAFFGAPIAHEDDPQRALYAALDIVDGIKPFCEEIKYEYGMDFNVRVGINTGTVVVGTVGSDLQVEYTAMGDAVNLASRMESTAQSGSIQITHDTFKLIAPLFDIESLGSTEVKGKRKPVPTYRVLRRKEQPGARAFAWYRRFGRAFNEPCVRDRDTDAYRLRSSDACATLQGRYIVFEESRIVRFGARAGSVQEFEGCAYRSRTPWLANEFASDPDAVDRS